MAVKACEQCGTEFEAARSTAKFCSATCRSRKRRRPAGTLAIPGMVDQVTRRLEQVAKLDTALGQLALIVARRLESGAETGSAIAALTDRMVKLLALVEGEGATGDLLDEVAKKRDEKTARARKASR